MSRHDKITAGPGHQIADDCRLKIDGFHRSTYRSRLCSYPPK
jgi:hypothetical protein